MNENTIASKADTLASNITKRFSGNGQLASDIEAVYDELDRADSDVLEAITSVAGGGLKSLFIKAVFFNGRCCLHSLIKDRPDYLIKGYLDCVTNIYRDYKEKTPEGERMSNRELAEEVAGMVMKGIDGANKSKWTRKKRIIFIVCLLVILFFSQDIAWTVIKAVLKCAFHRIDYNRFSTYAFMAQGYCGFLYLFLTTWVIKDSRDETEEIFQAPPIKKVLRYLSIMWYFLQYINEIILESLDGSNEESEASENFQRHINELQGESSWSQFIMSFGSLFVVTIIVYVLGSNTLRSIFTGIYSLLAAIFGFVFFAHTFIKNQV